MKQTIVMVFIFLWVACHKNYAQHKTEAIFHYGFIAKHKPSLDYLVRGDVKGFELDYYFLQQGPEYWKKIYRQPYYGIGYTYMDFGNPEDLGHGHSIQGIFLADILHHKKWNWTYKIAVGIAHLNQGNIAIGSHFNVYMNVDTYLEYTFNKNQFKIGLAAIHYSNGAIQMPNLGLNLFTYQLAYSRKFGETHNSKPFDDKPVVAKQHHFSIIETIGVKEIRPTGGQKFFLNTLSVNYNYHLSFRRKLHAGFDAVYDLSVKEIMHRNGQVVDNQLRTMRYGVHIGHVAYAGAIGFLAELGYMFHSPEVEQSPFFERAGLKFKLSQKWQVHVILRAHLEKADAAEWGLEYNF